MPYTREILCPAGELAHLGWAELDRDGYYLAVSPAFHAMLGTGMADIIGKPWQSTVHPDDLRRAQDAYEQARLTGHGFAEVRALRADGAILHHAITAAGFVDSSGAFAGYQCVRFDISRYKQDQEALMLAVESSPNGLVILDSAGRIRSVNRAAESLFGYARQELAGRPVEILLPHRYRDAHTQYREAFLGAEPGNGMNGRDLLGLRRDGREVPVQVYLNRIETAAGKLILCTVIDIAERIRYERQLELAKQAAESANRAKSDFLARMSHEIRTPMNLIMGMNALLLQSPLDAMQRQHVEISYRNVRRLLRLINGILDLSKVESGELTLQTTPFDLLEVLNECKATMATAIEQKGLLLEMSIDPGVWPYWVGDAERLQQVLLNLIGNSVKFTASGRIGVHVRPAQSVPGRNGLRVEVSDTGCGVPPEKARLVFEAFQQAEGAIDRPYEGTGLGLAIARTIVHLMAGEIWVEPKAGPGAKFVFTVFLPQASESVFQAGRSEAHAVQLQQTVTAGTRVLVAEDIPENVILLRAYLENQPVSLEVAGNGREAVEKRKQGGYHLILMDIQMPVMDGYTATREIRAWERAAQQPPIPIVALTAHALSEANAESMAAGCDGHLTKPIERADLVESIAKYSRRSAAPVSGNADPMAKHRPAFLANRREDIAKLHKALGAEDFKSIRVIGHNCKGTGTGYGFPEISRVGAAIELAARNKDLDAIGQHIGALESVVLTAQATVQ